MLQMMVGFSLGMSLLLAAAFASGYRDVPLPWQSRVAGFVMLAGLALTQWGHLEMVAQADLALPPRRYVVVLFLQSLGFYWACCGPRAPGAGWNGRCRRWCWRLRSRCRWRGPSPWRC